MEGQKDGGNEATFQEVMEGQSAGKKISVCEIIQEQEE